MEECALYEGDDVVDDDETGGYCEWRKRVKKGGKVGYRPVVDLGDRAGRENKKRVKRGRKGMDERERERGNGNCGERKKRSEHKEEKRERCCGWKG